LRSLRLNIFAVDDDNDDDDSYLLQLGFHPVAVFGSLVQKYERNSTKEETTHKRIQKHRIHKIDNKIQNNKQT
jgi:hypothetical protein